jgi:catechol 2,3-dioxygenase-like lactoylglutathione lyase family enzyme
MLGDHDAIANIAVKDLDAARAFYEEKLGMEKVGGQGDELIAFRSGSSTFNVYRSEYAGTNRATAVTWEVGGKIGETVEELRGRGIVFEHYDMPGLTLEGDLHVGYGMKVAWFKDPDGNILNVVGR